MRQIYGIDLSKNKFDVCFIDGDDSSELFSVVKNNFSGIVGFLENLPQNALLCCEHTGVYGDLLFWPVKKVKRKLPKLAAGLDVAPFGRELVRLRRPRFCLLLGQAKSRRRKLWVKPKVGEEDFGRSKKLRKNH